MKSLRASFITAVVVTVTLLGCQNQSSSESSLPYFADVHIGPHIDSSTVHAHILFDRVAEKDKPAGLAHYTEHLVALNSVVDDQNSPDRHAGAYTNRFTVGYQIKGPREDLDGIIKKLTTVFDPLKVDPVFAREEVDIVNREYDLRVINNVNRVANESMTPFLFEGNAMSNSIISTPQIIRTFTYDKAKAYFAATHRRQAAVLLVLGDVTEKEVLASVSASGLTPLDAEAIAEVRPAKFTLATPETKLFEFAVSSAEPRIKLRKIVKLDKPIDYDLLDFQARQLAATLISNLPGGLAGPLRYDNFMASSFSVELEPIDEQHIQLWFDATPDSGVSFEALQAAFEVALKTSSNGIPESTYERIKKRTRQYWLDWEDKDAVVEWMQAHTRHRVSVLRSPAKKETLKKLTEQITLDDINVLAKALQQPGRYSIAYIGKPDVVSSAAKQGDSQ